ncbi:gamma-glutamyl-gamma-aminobutyrate hydrolase family protein [Aeromicrobium sp. UC242_57]|uniref:gamma-glutamyl-gamma-aminobutyrate hydrolase family protein n=1 Tax=Aeromicrobium sp. UC242_57 TaxID=3374624 RepID=UPI00379E8BE2
MVHRESEEALSRPLHEVEVRAGSLLSRWIGVHGVVPVNSEHHQGISVLAPALTPVAFSSDGLVEGAESIEHNIVGVQWHPEILWPHEPCSAALLQGFVADCQARMPAGRLSE